MPISICGKWHKNTDTPYFFVNQSIYSALYKTVHKVRHPREGGDPEAGDYPCEVWIPAFAGTTVLNF